MEGDSIYVKLNPEFKEKWIEALKSGKYKQGKGKLRSNKEYYCCLGVACKIEGIPDVFLDTNVSNDYISTLPSEIITINLKPLNEGYTYSETVKTLVDMNDGNDESGISRKSFNEIADWIEENL